MAAGGKGRFGRGIELAKASWRVLKADRSLIAFPIIGAIAAAIAAAILFTPGAVIYAADETQEWALIVFSLLAAYAATFIAIFCSVALSACAARSLNGEDTTVSEGLAAARGKLGVIAAWSLLSFTVGLLLNALQNLASERGGALAGAAVGAIGGLAWAVASFFAIPVIALEGLGPIAALKRSTSLVKERWGEGVVGTGAIGIVMLPGILLSVLAIIGGASIIKTQEGAGIALIGLGVLLIVVTAVISGVLNTIFRVALFRFATEGALSPGFDQSALESAFRSKKAPTI